MEGKHTVQTAHCALVKQLSLPNISPLLLMEFLVKKKTFFVTQKKFPQNVISHPIDIYILRGSKTSSRMEENAPRIRICIRLGFRSDDWVGPGREYYAWTKSHHTVQKPTQLGGRGPHLVQLYHCPGQEETCKIEVGKVLK